MFIFKKILLQENVNFRHAKKAGYERVNLPKNKARIRAMEALKKGFTLDAISRKFKIPVSTLHRDKLALFKSGKLPENVITKFS